MMFLKSFGSNCGPWAGDGAHLLRDHRVGAGATNRRDRAYRWIPPRSAAEHHHRPLQRALRGAVQVGAHPSSRRHRHSRLYHAAAALPEHRQSHQSSRPGQLSVERGDDQVAHSLEFRLFAHTGERIVLPRRAQRVAAGCVHPAAQLLSARRGRRGARVLVVPRRR